MATFSLSGQTTAGQKALLPSNVSRNIWKEALAQSIIPGLASNVPIIIGDNTFPMVATRPAASIVGENANKPSSAIGLTSKTIKPIKAVVGLEFTMEAIIANPGGILGLLESEMSAALARQVDLAILFGRQASDGAAISGLTEFLNATTHRQELNYLLKGDEGLDAQIWAGMGGRIKAGKPVNGFAMDPRLVFELSNTRDTYGNRINSGMSMGGGLTSYAGLPTSVSLSVSGQVDASADTKVRGFGGNFDALRFGYALQLNTKKIEFGDPFGNGDLQRRNAVAFMTEAVFGWAIMDADAFVAFDDTVTDVAA